MSESDTAPPVAESAAPTARPTPAWRRIGPAELLFVLLVAAMIRQTADGGGMVDDPGIGWHLRNIDAMRMEGGWLYSDPFCLPRPGEPQPWRTNQWVGDLVLWLADRWAGLNGITVVSSVFLGLIYRGLYGGLRSAGVAWPLAFAWTMLAAFATDQSWVARPNLVTIWFIPLIARLCERYHRGEFPARGFLWMVPLFALWANCHGGFVGGLATLAGPAVGVEGITSLLSFDVPKRVAAGKRATVLAAATIGSFLGTLVNPYGIGLYFWLRTLLGNPVFVNLTTEWRSPDFHVPGAGRYEFVILLFPLLLGLSRYRPSLMSLGLAVAWLAGALTSLRHVPVFVLVVVPMLALAAGRLPWLRRLGLQMKFSDDVREIWGQPPERQRPGHAVGAQTAVQSAVDQTQEHGITIAAAAEPRPAVGDPDPRFNVAPAPVRLGLVGPVVISLTLLALARWGPPLAVHNPNNLPTQALDVVLQLHREGQDGGGSTFHNPNWGGYLTWHGWPDFKTWIDDRLEPQGEKHFDDYAALRDGKAGWKEYLRDKNITVVCLPPGDALSGYLAHEPDWEKVYGDEYAVVYRKRSPGGIP